MIAEAKVLGNHRITFWEDENNEPLLDGDAAPKPFMLEHEASFPGTADDHEDNPPDASGRTFQSDYDEAFRWFFHINPEVLPRIKAFS